MSEGRPRLVYVVTLAEVGGAQSYVRDLLPAMAERFEVTVAAHGPGPLARAASDLGIPFIALQHVRRNLSPVHDVLGLIELTRLFRRLRPDIVHLNSSKAGVLGRIAAAFADVPVCIFTAHGWAFKAARRPTASLFLWADRLVRPFATMIVCVSATELRIGLAARVCTARAATVIPNAVDVDRVQPRAASASRPVEVISVGRLALPKDFSTLITAFGLIAVDDARLTIVGDGPLRRRLEAEIADRSLEQQVEFIGEVADVGPYLARADVFVLSSHSEGMPLSVLEAMAAGLPVVASDVGGLHEIVDEGKTGFVVPAGSPAELAVRLAELVGDSDLRDRFGHAGRELVRTRFSLPPWRESHIELYRSLLSSRVGGASA